MIGFTSITFREKSIEEIINLALRANADGIEWGGDKHVPLANLGIAKQAYEATRKNGLRVLSYGAYYRCEFPNEIPDLLATAKTLKAPIIRVWAGFKKPCQADKAYRNLIISNLQKLCDACPHIQIGLEYHRNTLTEDVNSCLDLIRAVDRPNMKTYWQPNPELTLEDQLNEISLLRNYLISIHVFYWIRENDIDNRYLMKEGIATWEKYINHIGLKNINYVLEFTKDDKVDNFLSDMSVLASLCR